MFRYIWTVAIKLAAVFHFVDSLLGSTITISYFTEGIMDAFHTAGKRQVWLAGLAKSLNVLIVFILLFSALGTQIASADGANNVVDENQLDANKISSNKAARLEFTRPSARTAEQNNLPAEAADDSVIRHIRNRSV